jgi:3-methylcrotonyl-CoA carboxylase alpha subunit
VSTRVQLAGRGTAAWTLDIEGQGESWQILVGEQRHPVRLLERSGDRLTFELDGRVHAAHVSVTDSSVRVVLGGRETAFTRHAAAGAGRAAGSGYVPTADPMVRAAVPGKVLKVVARSGDLVDAGDPLVVIEAMKMEHTIVADQRGSVIEVHVVEGDTVQVGTLLVTCAWNGATAAG